MNPTLLSLLVISLGAALGACSRWGLALLGHQWLPSFPLGTLAANWLGAYLIGFAAAAFAAHTDTSPYVRLLLITGFLGGLTTFSTFSLEAVVMLQEQRWAAFGSHFLLHTVGCLALTVLGFASYQGLFKS